MEMENQNSPPSSYSSYNEGSCSPPDVLPLENSTNILASHTPGIIIPNRIFVGGIDYKVNERDLRHIFSQYGAVKEVKVVVNRSGMSKGYGFVTFETQDDVTKILSNANGFCFKEKKLYIGQAVKKQQPSGQTYHPHMTSIEPAQPHQMSFGTFYLTTSTGYPYTYHNGVAYFHCANTNPPPHHWSTAANNIIQYKYPSVKECLKLSTNTTEGLYQATGVQCFPQKTDKGWRPSPQLVLSQSYQPVHHQQPVYHHFQSVPNQYQWNTVQVPSGAVVYSQQPEYLNYPSDGGFFLPPGPVMEDVSPENQMFPPSCIHVKSKYRRFFHPKNCYHLPGSSETPGDFMFQSSQPLLSG